MNNKCNVIKDLMKFINELRESGSEIITESCTTLFNMDNNKRKFIRRSIDIRTQESYNELMSNRSKYFHIYYYEDTYASFTKIMNFLKNIYTSYKGNKYIYINDLNNNFDFPEYEYVFTFDDIDINVYYVYDGSYSWKYHSPYDIFKSDFDVFIKD